MTYNVSSGTLNSTIPYHLWIMRHNFKEVEFCILASVLQSVRAAAFTLTLFAGGGFHAMRQRLQSELNHLSAEDP